MMPGSDVVDYEAILAAADPHTRKLRGVYYTPQPVVDFIVRSVDLLLAQEFELPDGLADRSKLVVVDPAVGTGAFLLGITRIVEARGRAAGECLARVRGFELMPEAHAIAQRELGARGLGLTLANALEHPWLSADEARARPILAVIGNPPYSGHSANKASLVDRLTDDYKTGVPELSKPGQAKWLKDDYVKFMRLAQWHIEQVGHGILAFVTNHAWLSNPTFRGMRRSLLHTFDRIWLLDLHGSAKRGSRTGERDENVFDIQQGVAISIFVKRPSRGRPQRRARVDYAELRGSRPHKFAVLRDTDVATTSWTRVAEPEQAFVPGPAAALQHEYARFCAIPSIFCHNGDPAPGIVTTHDEFAIAWTAAELGETIEQFCETQTEPEARRRWKLCAQQQWAYERAIAALRTGEWREQIGPLLYRPFDVRWTAFNRNVAVHQRTRVSRHLLGRDNLALIVTRQQASEGAWAHGFVVAGKPIESAVISNKTKEINYVFPLWLYADDPPDERRPNQPGEREASPHAGRRPSTGGFHGREANISAAFTTSLPGSPTPEQVLAYVYAILHARSYRERYASLLRGDFPRIPVITHAPLCASLIGHGERLVALHTLRQPPKREFAITTFPVPGSNAVTQRPTWRDCRVWINQDQYFDQVSESAWQFQIGAYTPAQKWLLDRRKAKRPLAADDITQYQTMIGVLAESAQIMAAIDAAIAEAGGWATLVGP